MEDVISIFHFVHRADDIYILGDVEAVFEWVILCDQILILCLHLAFHSSIPRVNREEQFTEYLGDFASVDFVDDEDIRLRR